MSRVRISPTEWRLEEPGAAHIRFRSAYANVPAATIPDMRPILTNGACFQNGQTTVARTIREAKK